MPRNRTRPKDGGGNGSSGVRTPQRTRRGSRMLKKGRSAGPTRGRRGPGGSGGSTGGNFNYRRWSNGGDDVDVRRLVDEALVSTDGRGKNEHYV